MAGYVKGIHHIALKVSNFERSMAFYMDVLGLNPLIWWGEGDSRAVMLDAGDGSCLELFAGGDGNGQPGSWFHLALKVDDCDAAYQAAITAGAACQTLPKDVDIPSQPQVTPVRIAFIKGLDGEVIEFFQTRS